jgi:hypothetical protein
MTNTRIRAKDYIIPNRTPYVNPRWARHRQPSVPGRLTSRTNKLKFMVGHNARASNPLYGWIKFGSILAKQKSVAFLSQVRATKTSFGNERYTGTIRVLITTGHHTLFDMVRKQPQESLKTLAVRFQWEYGIRGEKRPIFAPVSKQTDFDMRKLVEQKNNLIWREV